jgi:hypothetical protein
VDFFDFCAFPNLWKWVFNVADVFVCVGAGLLALWLILDMVKDYKAEKAKNALESGAAVETEAADKGDGDDRAE